MILKPSIFNKTRAIHITIPLPIVKIQLFLIADKNCFKSLFFIKFEYPKPFTMKKEEYFSPLVSTDELETEGILCASAGDDTGLPGSDFDDDAIYDGGTF